MRGIGSCILELNISAYRILHACAPLYIPLSCSSSITTLPFRYLFARMVSSTAGSIVPPEELASFQRHLAQSSRIIALLGAGVSASSGLPTFRGAGGLWRTHEATELATPEAFARDPGLVWQFYNYRRHMALKAKPNPAHYALAELSRKKEGFITLSQNVDGTYATTTCSATKNIRKHKLTSHTRPRPPRRPSSLSPQAPARLPLRRKVL